MITVNKEILDYTKNEIAVIVMRLSNVTEESKVSQISDDITNAIDWNNSALMHKGLSWIAKNYLMKQNMI